MNGAKGGKVDINVPIHKVDQAVVVLLSVCEFLTLLGRMWWVGLHCRVKRVDCSGRREFKSWIERKVSRILGAVGNQNCSYIIEVVVTNFEA